jgi:glycogen debranching enzyme
MSRWRASVPDVETDHPGLSLALRRCSEDIGALRIFDPDLFSDLPVIAAGAPWFMTLFGRDSLITAWMSMIADTELAQGVLQALALFQGRDVDDQTEEEPGKILHEMRFVAGDDPRLVGDVYYGSIDATPLFVMLLGELRRWGGARSVVDRLLPHADRALEWITTSGDRDGDGFVEYARRNEHGLANQGWKDSWDAVRHADGTLATGPIALCEVQGYVYAAYLARAHLAEEAGDHELFERLTGQASDLRRRFNDAFWLDELGTYALALDGDKRPVAVPTSNVGHCLWTGIVEPSRAESVAARLVADDMFGGWGIRTLSAGARAYNPVSYHNGSVWPHDNAIAAAGLMRYGRVEEAHRVITAQLDVAAEYEGRMPELFAGFSRAELPVPASYPTSCSPQAWASASPLLWLRTMLGLAPSASNAQVWLAPRLPAAIERLHVSGIKIGDRRITIDVEGDDVQVDGLDGFQLMMTPRPPLTALVDGV